MSTDPYRVVYGYVRKIARLEKFIEYIRGNPEDKAVHRYLAHQHDRLRSELATYLNTRHLGAGNKGLKGISFCVGTTKVNSIILVQGVPSKENKTNAAKWMQKRGIEWDGSAPKLRQELRRTLLSGMGGTDFPGDFFGLHVRFSVRIDALPASKSPASLS